MAVIDLFSLPNVKIKSASIAMGVSQPDLSFSYEDALNDDAPTCAMDDIVLIKKEGAIVYKGIVRKKLHSLSSEGFDVTVVGSEYVIASAPWTAINFAYNDASSPCGQRAINCTIAQALNFEYTQNMSGPQTWFSSIEIPASVGSLICGPTTTYQRSYFDFVQSLIALYPHIRILIEYDPSATTIFPIGKLVLIDTTVGRTSHTLEVGGATPDVVDYSITDDATETAANISLYGWGNFTEELEVLQPDWNPLDEVIPVSETINTPTVPTNNLDFSSYSYLKFQIGLSDLSSVPVILMKLVDYNVGVNTQLYFRIDYDINFSLNAIIWNNWDVWVDQSTGVMSASVNGDKPTSGGDWRRLAAYNNNHLNKTAILNYTLMGADCYRRYKVTKPVANLHLLLTRIADPFNPGDSVQVGIESSPVIQVATPDLDLAGSGAVPFPGHIAYKYTPANQVITRVTKDPTGLLTYDQVDVGGGVTPGWKTSNDTYYFSTDTPGFREGDHCVYFESRQLGYNFGKWGARVSYTFFTWDIACLYTGWQNLVEVRTGAVGDQVYARAVWKSAYKYTRIDSVVLTDLSARLISGADAMLAYYGNKNWVGSIVAQIQLNGTSHLWEIPFAIGDTVSLTGAVRNDLTAFVGVINQLDLGSLDNGTISIGISRVEPKKNPFIQRPPGFIDLEAFSLVPSDIFGLQPLQGR